jgi:hypothetical protein
MEGVKKSFISGMELSNKGENDKINSLDNHHLKF